MRIKRRKRRSTEKVPSLLESARISNTIILLLFPLFSSVFSAAFITIFSSSPPPPCLSLHPPYNAPIKIFSQQQQKKASTLSLLILKLGFTEVAFKLV